MLYATNKYFVIENNLVLATGNSIQMTSHHSCHRSILLLCGKKIRWDLYHRGGSTDLLHLFNLIGNLWLS